MAPENTAPQKSETAKREEEVLAFWRENKTFERSLEKDSPKGEFVFYDGPPFATGLPHHGSLLSSIIKDVIPRYKTMRGYHVRRRWGWDTHGLPIETLVEKELGLKTKKEVLEMGIGKFNAAARSMVLQFVNDWEKYVERIGRWVDFKNSYKTMDNTYIESVWWALKQLWEKKLLYEGRKVLMYCPHDETVLAKAEIAMDNTYKDITEEAVTVKFKMSHPGQYGLPENTYLLAWTTTPWTLPGNVGLAVGEDINYVAQMGMDGSVIVMAEALAPESDVHKRLKGKDLVGAEYEPLYKIPAVMQYDGPHHLVLPADFVSTEEGTGIVHTAVMYGEDDFALGQKHRLPMVQLLDSGARYNEQAPEFVRGKYIKDAEKDIKRDLDERGLMYERKNHTHSYPHCYRCGTPLIYNAVSSWFINIQEVKQRMLAENEKVNWVPDHLKHGRFYNIVENAPDWTISRNRFWASPLPIWKERGGDRVMVIGSIQEMRERAKTNGNRYFVMRHGEAENNIKDILNCDNSTPCHLTEKGRAQVKASLETLPQPDIIIASPLVRGQETAEIVRKHFGLEYDAIKSDARVQEVQFGQMNGRPRAEYYSKFDRAEERFSKKIGDAETWRDIRKRVGDLLAELERTHENKTILIISHDSPIILMQSIAHGESEQSTGRKLDKSGTSDILFAKNGEVMPLPYTPLPRNERHEIDLHRPYTDSIVLRDDEGREYERIPEVVDCWVESGSMPFAEYHYPFENQSEFEKRAPGDFIAEYIAQTRTWFYYMHAMGVLLFDRLAFRNVVSTGTILAADGQKISKSKRNYTDPLDLINQYGADAMRLYLMGSPVMQAEDLRFRDEDVRDAHNRVIGILWNTCKFYELYKDRYDGTTNAHKSPHVLDRWVLALLKKTIVDATEAMEAYDVPRTVKSIRAFVDEYSTWYVRRSRERAKGDGDDLQYTLATQREVLLALSRLIAPIMPFLAESMWSVVGTDEESVHLASWPEAEGRRVDGFLKMVSFGLISGRSEKLLAEMASARALVSRALEARDRAGIKVRQPLSKLSIPSGVLTGKDGEALRAIIAEEVNVKSVVDSDKVPNGEVQLDTELTDELREEGFVRELIRAVQSARKEAGLQPRDMAKLRVATDDATASLIEKHAETIREATHMEEITNGALDTQPVKVGDASVALAVVQS